LLRADGLVAGVFYGFATALAIGGWRSLSWAEKIKAWEEEREDALCLCYSKRAFPPSPIGGIEVEKGLMKILPWALPAFIAAHAALLIARGARRCAKGRCRFRRASAVAAACRSLAAIWARQDPFQERVRKEVGRIRVNTARKILMVAANFTMIATLISIPWEPNFWVQEPDMASRVETSYSDPVSHLDWYARDAIVDSSSFGLVMLYGLIVMLAEVLPVTVRTLDSFSVLLEASWIFRTCVAPIEFSGDPLLREILFSAALICGNAWLHTFLKVTSALTEVVARLRHGLEPDSDVAYVAYAVYEAATRRASHILIFWALEWLRWSQARATVQALQADRSNALVKRTLTAMCDAVVPLSDGLRVAQPCPQLGALLLRRSSPAMLEQPLAELLHVEDCQPFAEHMAAEAEFASAAEDPLLEPVPAHALHVRMRDCNGSYVHVELFCSCIPDAISGRLCYLVGVKEDALAEQRGAPEYSGAALPAGMHRCTIPESSTWASSDGATPSLPSEPGAEDVCVWVDAESEGLPVVRYNREFAALSGPSADTLKLLDWFDNPKAFQRFLREGVEAVLQDAEATPRATGIDLRPPHLVGFGVRLTATVLLSLPAEGDPEDHAAAGGRQIVQLSLQDVEAKTARRRGPHGSGTPVVPRASGALHPARGQARAGRARGGPAGTADNKAVLRFRPFQDFEVLTCSAGLRALGGSLPRNAQLLNYIEEGRDELREATQLLTNILLDEMEPEAGWRDVRSAHLGALRLRLLGVAGAVSCEACTLEVQLRVRPGVHEFSVREDLTACLVLEGPAAAGGGHGRGSGSEGGGSHGSDSGDGDGNGGGPGGEARPAATILGRPLA